MKSQYSLIAKSKDVVGGTKTNSHLRCARTLSTKHWIHIVHKSEKARGSWSLRGYHAQIAVKQIYFAQARKYGVLVDKFSNNGNHIHAKIKIQNRQLFKSFLKAVGALIARLITRARRGDPRGKFWTQIPFTRVCKTQEEVLYLDGYIEANKVEAIFGEWARVIYLEWYQAWVMKLRRRSAA